MPFESRRDEFVISTDPARIDLPGLHAFLRQSYWAREIPFEIVRRSVENSLPFGLYHADRMIGFARAVTDRATFAWIADVFVLEEYRGRGLAQWLMQTMRAHPDLQGLRRWILATRDAHDLYRKAGFEPLHHPPAFMEIWKPDFYVR